jgi:hypothetical protein
MLIPKKVETPNGTYKVKVDNSHKYYGTTDTTKKTIVINKEKSLRAGGNEELKDTIKHEVFHAMNPQATEAEVPVHKSLSRPQDIDELFKKSI